MAGKPELSVAPQQQPPGVQNVVVYVSNDNFAQAYAVGQQNVAGFTSQGSSPTVTQQNGAVVYANSAHTMAPMATPGKDFTNKPLVKPTEFQPNGVLENGSVAHPNNFYACNPSPVIAQNGYQQAGTNIVNNITAYHNSVNHMGQSVPMLNNSNFDSAVKNVIGFSAAAPSGSELYSVAAQADKQVLSGRPEQHKVVREDSVTSETYITADSGYVVMGAEVTGQNGVMFPRCDSVRSETAESSCSSLSSGDSQGEPSGVVLMPTQAPSSQSSDIVMYDNSVSVNMRPGQPLGNLVLTMMPPGAGGHQPQQQQAQSQPQPQAQPQPQLMGISPASSTANSVTVPLGWKRIVTSGIVIYISPSSTVLGSLEQVKEYLMTQGTCKCGLECPLKYETVFNFDPKVNAKPYTVSPDTNTGDLTKLCNHKRKLLAMASMSTSPGPKPPVPVAVAVDPTKLRKDGGIKRKKRKPGPYAGVSVSQLLAQREKLAMAQQNYSKEQASGSPQFVQQQQQPWPGAMIPGVQNAPRPQAFTETAVNQQNPGISQQFIRYPNQPASVNRVIPGSQVMVGGSMMISQQGNNINNISQQQQQIQQIQNQQMMYQQMQNSNQQLNQNQHIIGPNGQVISVQQAPGHHMGQISNAGNQIISNPVGHQIMGNSTMIPANNGNNIVIQGQNMNITNQLQQQRIQQATEVRGPGRPIQSGMNILPNSTNNSNMQQEFNPRIQQQQFYGQNVQYQNTMDQNKLLQQQFDVNKGVRQNFIPNGQNAVFSGYRSDQNPLPVQQANQQMIMVSSQNHQKQQSWQHNKPGTPIQTIQNPINSQNQQPVVSMQSPMSSNQGNQNVFDRVPPLHHHTPPPPIWNEDVNRKKVKMSKQGKKQRPYNVADHQQRFTGSEGHPPCPNIDVRQIQSDNKSVMHNNQYPQHSSGPSFMEDPSGYLAQQTALLNSTISRQTGVNNCANYMCHSPSMPSQIPHTQSIVNVPNSQTVGVPLPSNMIPTQIKQNQVFNNRTNMQNMSMINKNQQSSQQQNIHENQFQNQNNLPDSSAVNENANSPQCHSYVGTSEKYNTHEQSDSRLVNQNQYNNGKNQMRLYQQSQSAGSASQPSTPNPNFQDDNPVTSSTFSEKYGQTGYIPSPDSRPIQGGTVSTSNGSPIDGQSSQSEPSSAPSTPTPLQQRNSDTPMMNASTNSSSASFTMTASVPVCTYSQTPQRDSSSVTGINCIQNPSQILPSGVNINQSTNQNNPSIKLDGYCPHPHTTGSPLGMPPRMTSMPFSVHSGMITTMASGRTFGSNTITSVLAGRASTSTVSINNPATIPVTSASSNTFTSQANALISAATMPTQSISVTVSKSPLEMVQSVVSSIQIPHSQQGIVNAAVQQNQQISPQQVIKNPQSLPPGHILVSSGGQLLMATTGNGQQGIMAPPPPKLVSNTSPMPPLSASPMVTNVTASVTQVIPAVAQQVLGQQTVLVNALPAPFVIQPGVVTVDGMTVGQNMQIPHLVTGNVIQQQIQIEGNQDHSNRTQHHSPGFVANRQPALLSPESNKKKGKKRKMPSQTVASMLHIASQQNSGMVMQQPQQGFSQQGFQMAHSPQGIQAGPMLQALTIVPGKAGVPPQIVMNGQPSAATGTFSTQQLITNSQPAPQINLLQPVNLLNGATGVVQNFPTIQQFIVPNLGGMVMNADGTATLLQDAPNIGMQLQLQNVNGQNVLTPVQNTGNMFGHAGGQSILAAGPAGMVIRTPGTAQGKIIQQQHSPGAQFLSPNGSQFLMNGAQFNGQLSPLVANVSPTQQVTFSTAPQAVRPSTSMPQEFIQCNQMGQTLMVPCAPAPTITVTSASNQQNTTYVHQNTTIVQQQTTMVSNNQIQNFAVANQNTNPPNGQNIAGTATTLNVDPNFIINNSPQNDKQQNQIQSLMLQRQSPKSAMMRHSVSTQTAANQKLQASAVTTNTFCQTSMSTAASSPPDTTTHSPLAAGGQSPANADTTTHSVGTGSTDEGMSPSPSNSAVTGSYADTITIQGRQQASSMAMVHCISSSEPDSGDLCGSGSQSEMDWSRSSSVNPGYKPEYEITRGSHTMHISRKPETPTHMAYVESSTVVSGMHLIAESMKTQESIVSSRNYDRNAMKRKHGDTLVIMETRHMHTALQDDEEHSNEKTSSTFVVGDVVWGAAHGCPLWPGKLIEYGKSQKGKVWVQWFGGDKTPCEVDVATLQTLSQGLDAHHRARKKCRKSRKLNTQLENAIQEAMAELDRISEKKEQSSEDLENSHQEKTQPEEQCKTAVTVGRLRSSQR